jgi:hypothetical protein
MVWTPTDSVLVANVATPPLKVPVPIVVLPSLNVTEPVGVPVPVTVAVNVTEDPAVAGFALDVSVVAVVWRTVCVSTADVLVTSSVSPP